VKFEDRMLELRAPRGFYYDYLARADHLAEVTELARRFFERDLVVKVRSDETANGTPETRAAQRAETMTNATETALGNPVVRAAVDILGGEVQEVRQRRPREGG
jgi:hypothetical protein